MTRDEQTNAYVLVVDDDIALLRLIRLTLEADGFRVRMARNGLEALQTLEDAGRPDAVVLDLNMPVMDGPTFLHKTRDANVEAPVLILSASPDAGQVAGELAVDAYLTKPFDPIALTDEVSRLVGSRT
jgi:CheY-like chemotaxis protein